MSWFDPYDTPVQPLSACLPEDEVPDALVISQKNRAFARF
jgi:hypothetical protein